MKKIIRYAIMVILVFSITTLCYANDSTQLEIKSNKDISDSSITKEPLETNESSTGDFPTEIIVTILTISFGVLTSSSAYLINKHYERKDKKRSLKEENYCKFIESLARINLDVDNIYKLAESMNYITLVGSPELVAQVYKYRECLSANSTIDAITQNEIYTEMIRLMRKELNIDTRWRKFDVSVYPITGS